MTANLLLMGYLAFMVYWWSRHGLYSAWLHLMATVTAMGLAIALWDKLVISLLLPRMGQNAWGVGLIVPFIVWLLLIRIIMDRLSPWDMDLNLAVYKVGGGVCGLLSAILTAGVTGDRFEFYVICLWVWAVTSRRWSTRRDRSNPIHKTICGCPSTSGRLRFSNTCRTASFFSGYAWDEYLPSLRWQAVLFRMRYDTNANNVATPDAVKVTNIKPSRLADQGVGSGRHRHGWARYARGRF